VLIVLVHVRTDSLRTCVVHDYILTKALFIIHLFLHPLIIGAICLQTLLRALFSWVIEPGTYSDTVQPRKLRSQLSIHLDVGKSMVT
jgi:hypothetical protein